MLVIHEDMDVDAYAQSVELIAGRAMCLRRTPCVALTSSPASVRRV